MLPEELIQEIDCAFSGLLRGQEPQQRCLWFDEQQRGFGQMVQGRRAGRLMLRQAQHEDTAQALTLSLSHQVLAKGAQS